MNSYNLKNFIHRRAVEIDVMRGKILDYIRDDLEARTDLEGIYFNGTDAKKQKLYNANRALYRAHAALIEAQAELVK